MTASDSCKSPPGKLAPQVDRAKCEGKTECVKVCPFDVFEVRRIDDADFARLGLFAKLKSVAHGRKTAYAPRAAACEGCGKCVAACPEKAIRLVPVAVS
ncbi:MAG: Ferredoxin [Deltaproteobacteria bacterium]|nr:Ferredoxin [Deltaproteobacteria bacterium]